jgi:hypothetical protein
MYSKHARGICAHCGRNVAITGAGNAMRHGRRWPGWPPEDCRGTGQPAKTTPEETT